VLGYRTKVAEDDSFDLTLVPKTQGIRTGVGADEPFGLTPVQKPGFGRTEVEEDVLSTATPVRSSCLENGTLSPRIRMSPSFLILPMLLAPAVDGPTQHARGSLKPAVTCDAAIQVVHGVQDHGQGTAQLTIDLRLCESESWTWIVFNERADVPVLDRAVASNPDQRPLLRWSDRVFAEDGTAVFQYAGVTPLVLIAVPPKTAIIRGLHLSARSSRLHGVVATTLLINNRDALHALGWTPTGPPEALVKSGTSTCTDGTPIDSIRPLISGRASYPPSPLDDALIRNQGSSGDFPDLPADNSG
jgi:hypothetical protein